jgi:IclR family acetate operon transcriptional repressor
MRRKSVQELTNGLLARGYLIECDRRFHLGPGPFILAARANKLAAVSLDHRFVAELAQAARLHRPRRGARRGRHRLHRPRRRRITQPHIRRPHPRPSPALYQRAGKTLLANVPDDEVYRLLDLASPQQAGEVRQFLAELPEIRCRRLAFNRGVTFGDAFAVATLLLTPDGSLIAAISAAVDASEADRLHAIGEQLKKTVDTLGPKYGLKPR